MKTTVITVAVALGLAGIAQEAPVDWVNPFIGCTDNGHCTPAACVPFGLVQAGADTGNKGWNYCGGYRYEDPSIMGFSQTHISGTGVPDLGDLRLQPFTGTGGTNDFRSVFRKETETAKPGYYAVTLDDFGVQAEVTATHHASIYRFVYSKGGTAKLLVDCQYGIGGDAFKQILASDVRLDGRTGIAGTVRRRCWVERTYAFAVQFDRPFASVTKLPPRHPAEKAPRYVFTFDVPAGGTLMVKVGLSAENGVEAAWKNLTVEIPAWDFADVRAKATAAWNKVLGRVVVGGDAAQKTSFYTALYHLYIQPNNLADVGATPFHSTFSCWDTFRAAHPLYTILVPEQVDGFVNSMLEQGRRTGFLPVWTLWGKDNQCMIGTHSVPAIVDWFLKKTGNAAAKMAAVPVNSSAPQKCSACASDWESRHLGGADKAYWEAAYAQVKDSLTVKHDHRRKERWDLLDKYGYYPFDEIKGESVSRTGGRGVLLEARRQLVERARPHDRLRARARHQGQLARSVRPVQARARRRHGQRLHGGQRVPVHMARDAGSDGLHRRDGWQGGIREEARFTVHAAAKDGRRWIRAGRDRPHRAVCARQRAEPPRRLFLSVRGPSRPHGRGGARSVRQVLLAEAGWPLR